MNRYEHLTNYHSHSLFCDGRADMETFVRFAISNHFSAYGFSSHAPLPFPTAWTMSWDSWDDYYATFVRLRNDYSNLIELYLGLEIDYLNKDSNPASTCYQELPLDYRIGSVHLLYNKRNELVDIDASPEKFHAIIDTEFSGELDNVVSNYYESELEMMRLGGFDILGHADKVHFNSECYRKGFREEKWYVDLVHDFWNTVAHTNYLVEVNTKAYPSHHVFYPDERYFPLLKSLGIPLVVNSDAHYPDLVNGGRMEALEALKRAGISEVWELHDHHWQAVPLSRNIAV